MRRAQVAELLEGIAPVEQVEHVLEQLAREIGVGWSAGDERVQLLTETPRTSWHDQASAFSIFEYDRLRGPRSTADGDDLLGEDVEGVALGRRVGSISPSRILGDDAPSSRRRGTLGKIRPRLT